MTGGKKFDVAICGGGVGGLICALALSKYPDIHVDIYEAARTFTELGAGIGIWPRTRKIMKTLGLEEDIQRVLNAPREGEPTPVFTYRKSDQSEGFEFFQMVTPGGLLMLHRADFQQILLKHISQVVKTHTSKRLCSYSQPSSPSPITLSFEDGSTATCNVLIGADGIRSSARASLIRDLSARATATNDKVALGRMVEPTWSGCIAWRSLIPVEKLRAADPTHHAITQPTQYLGKDAYILVYPISQGRMINFVAFQVRHDLEGTVFPGHWVTPNGSKEDFVGAYKGWEPEVQTLLKCVEKPLRWAIHTAKHLPSLVSGRVVIIGDAAHAMTPHQGSGAGQAIEDAYLLATLLGHPSTTLQTIPLALSAYDAVRRPEARRVAEISIENGKMFTFHLDEYQHLERLGPEVEKEKLREMAGRFIKNWQWSWMGEIGGDIERAVRMFEVAVRR
ncbi:hypothetical protein JAAARDRAFT_70435 [Jaapia argillacea MUCL 33604]|uniref:FAD-binding domain-containing protein n=1 Tax=Jaapia argillacea MUCL 33604 TaxID=933084 RepID=A0A067PSB5_9AGAM|nr:hypothetical protein JAAARDRAFT_70435 [Jaapia argillacea MUCL 33604]